MNGVILVNKDINRTSRDMVNDLNHIFNMKKIGHTGTLDPMATGVLVMCLGRYTKLIDHLSELKKEYIAKIKFGIKTDTLDITGNILETKNETVTKDTVINVLNSMIGEFKQTIPKYSAKKINGKKLYEYARENIDIVLPTNIVNIYNLELLEFNSEDITIKCLVSKGTYIRSLIEEICNRLNVIGTMSYLERTKQGKFSIEDSFTIKQIKDNNYKLLKINDLLDTDNYNLNEEEYKKVINGSRMQINSNSLYILFLYNNEEIALYKKDNLEYKMDILLIEK